MKLAQNQRLPLHIVSIMFVITLSLSYSLNKLVFIMGISIVFFNIWSIYQIVSKKQQVQTRYSSNINQNNGEQHQYSQNNQNRSRCWDQLQKIIKKSQQYRQNTEPPKNVKYNIWGKQFLKTNHNLESIKKFHTEDFVRERSYKSNQKQNQWKQQSSYRKISQYFSYKVSQPQQVMNKLIETVCDFLKKKQKIDERTIKQAIQDINQQINVCIQRNIDNIINNYQVVNKFLNNMFGISLSFNQSSSKNSITYSQFITLVQFIKYKKTLPKVFSTQYTLTQITIQLQKIQTNMINLLDFSHNPEIHKLNMMIQQLKSQYSNQNIIFTNFTRHIGCERGGDKHIFKIQQISNKLIYNKFAQIKASAASTIVFLFVLFNINSKQYTNKYQKEIKHRLYIN